MISKDMRGYNEEILTPDSRLTVAQSKLSSKKSEYSSEQEAH